MKTSLRFIAFLACSVLVACSSEDAEVAPADDTGTPSGDTSVDSTPGDTGSGEDSSMTDTGGSGGDTGGADSGSADSTSDAPSEAASEGGADAGGETATDGGAGKSCTFSGGGCDATEYCDAPACDMGTCKPRPATATKEYAPVCGCDGVTYWNDSVAKITGHSAVAGKCPLAGGGVGAGTKFCGIKGCADDEVCIQDLTDHGSCGLGGFGKTCWRLVSGATCPSGAADTPKVRECNGGTPDACTGYCHGVLAQNAGDITGFLEDSTCP
jgi:hypothetical protein